MSNTNGVIRIGRKGIKKFAFGDGEPFDVDVVTTFHRWIAVDEALREPHEGNKIPAVELPNYNSAAQSFVQELSGTEVTVAEALDFLARLREQYDDLADFFRAKSPRKPDSPDSSAAELQFSQEES